MSQAQPMSGQGGQGQGGQGDGGYGNQSPYEAAAASQAADPYGCQANPNSAACVNCANNPSDPSCRGMQATDANGNLSFASPGDGSTNPGEFNVGSMDGTSDSDPSTGMNGDEAMGGASAQYKAVPNNSGGAIPGGGGSSEAKLDPQSRSTASSSGSVNTNIEQGFRSGGGGGSSGGGSAGGGDPSGPPL